MPNKAFHPGHQLQTVADDRWQVVVRISFSLFLGSLLTLLVLLYGGFLLI
jgi:hypothetical protein